MLKILNCSTLIMENILHYLLCALLVLQVWSINVKEERISYGGACSKTRRCERTAWLICSSGICGCAKQDAMFFEPATGKCVVKAGERCKDIWEENRDGTTLMEAASCIANSICTEEGVCSCIDGFCKHSNGSCILRSRIFGGCDEQAKQCDELKSELVGGKCVGLYGEACIENRCTLNAWCSDNKCLCQNAILPTPDKRCPENRKYLKNCSSDDECKSDLSASKLKCMGGQCVCNPINSMFGAAERHLGKCLCNEQTTLRYPSYDTQQRQKCKSGFSTFDGRPITQCLGKAGHPCINGYCVPGSFCDYDECQSDSFNGTCKCLEGFKRTQDDACAKSYGAICESNKRSECTDGLVCKTFCEGRNCTAKCSCRFSNQNFNQISGKCASPLEGPCNVFTGCPDGAHCVPFGNHSVEGQCQCMDGFIESGGKCDLTFGQPCNISTICDSVAGLTCIEGTCQCEDFRTYDSEAQNCLGLVGAKCNMEILGKRGQQCVRGSECTKQRGKFQDGKCKCKFGYSVNSNYTCDEIERSATTEMFGNLSNGEFVGSTDF